MDTWTLVEQPCRYRPSSWYLRLIRGCQRPSVFLSELPARYAFATAQGVKEVNTHTCTKNPAHRTVAGNEIEIRHVDHPLLRIPQSLGSIYYIYSNRARMRFSSLSNLNHVLSCPVQVQQRRYNPSCRIYSAPLVDRNSGEARLSVQYPRRTHRCVLCRRRR